MANTIYYGISTTAADVAVKQVVMLDTEYVLNKGDILSVYFAHKNEAESPRLALYIGDVDNEANTTNSNGANIYNTGVIPAAPGAWTDGEVVNFSWTHNGSIIENADNDFYWEMISKVKATDVTYGVVTIDGDNADSAISKEAFEDALNNLQHGELVYDDNYAQVQDKINIGTLTYTTYDFDGTSTSTILPLNIPPIPERTSQLENDSGFITDTIDGQLNFITNQDDPKEDDQQILADGHVVIDLDQDGTHDVVIISPADIILDAHGQVTVGTLGAQEVLTPYLNVDEVHAYTQNGTITFTSPTNLESTVTMNGGIYIGDQTLAEYIQSFQPSSTWFNNQLADLLSDYLITRRYYAGPFSIKRGNIVQVDYGTGANNVYYNNSPNNPHYLTAQENLNIEGYEIVGVITWETWMNGAGSTPHNASIYGIWWEGNDPQSGILHLKLTAFERSADSINTSVDILYKKVIAPINVNVEPSNPSSPPGPQTPQEEENNQGE